jgi:hypothetical protein
MTMRESELTIMRAASNIAREDALSLAANASTSDERECVNAGLLAHLTIERYLAARDDVDRPF